MIEEAIVITGVGCVTPLGVSLDATWEALLRGTSVTDRGVVPIAPDAAARVEQLGLRAALEAIGDCNVEDAALFVGTSKGAADQWLADGHVGAYGLATLATTLADTLGLRGERRTYSGACASGLQALAAATMRMRVDGVRRALVVASESSLHDLWHGTFRRIGVLAPPGEPGRPFDASHAGFVISEAAAALLLERRAPRPGEVVVADARMAGDAYHLTGSDPDGGMLRHLIASVAAGNPIGLVHAHATGTGSDPIELGAIDATLGGGRPIVYSHKGAIGHTLGASGLMAAALTTRMLRDRRVPPHATMRNPIDAVRCRLATSTSTTCEGLRTAICLASGFGGTAAAARLTRQSDR